MKNVNMSRITVVAMVIAAISLSVATYAAINYNQDVQTFGSIVTSPNIGVFSDSDCTQNLTSLSWGAIGPGSSVQRTVYVKNTGAGASIDLSMTTLNLLPAGASGYITVSWDKEGTTLSPVQSTAAVITLSVNSGIVDVTDFSVTVRITGTAD